MANLNQIMKRFEQIVRDLDKKLKEKFPDNMAEDRVSVNDKELEEILSKYREELFNLISDVEKSLKK